MIPFAWTRKQRSQLGDFKNALAILLAVVLWLPTNGALAQPYGVDLHNTMHPASGGMAGVSIALPQDLPSAIFGNPATMTYFDGTQFTFGASWLDPSLRVKHDGTVTGEPFEGKSGTDGFLVPNIGVTHDLRGKGVNGVFGLGLTALSGLGTDFKGEPGSFGTSAEYVLLGANSGIALRITDRLSAGVALTIGFGQLDAGLAEAASEVHDVGFRGTFGLSYDQLLPATTVGLFYQTEMAFEFDNIFMVAPGQFVSFKLEQPQNVGFGIANRSLLKGNLLLAVDILYKDWESSKFWGDLYENQWAYALGAELSWNLWRFRLGYGYSDNPVKDNPGDEVVGITVGEPVVEYLQATQAPVIYRHRLTAGIGRKNVLPNMDFDGYFGWLFEADHNFGTHTQAELHSWHFGMGLTWQF